MAGAHCEAVNEFFPDTTEIPKGHMKQQRQGARSTKPKNAKEDEAQDANAMSILATAARRKKVMCTSKCGTLRRKCTPIRRKKFLYNQAEE